MRWNNTYKMRRKVRLASWHKWFAWHPIEFNHETREWVWLELLARKRYSLRSSYFQYKELKEIL